MEDERFNFLGCRKTRLEPLIIFHYTHTVSTFSPKNIHLLHHRAWWEGRAANQRQFMSLCVCVFVSVCARPVRYFEIWTQLRKNERTHIIITIINNIIAFRMKLFFFIIFIFRCTMQAANTKTCTNNSIRTLKGVKNEEEDFTPTRNSDRFIPPSSSSL